MKETIGYFWRPSPKTSSALLNSGYSQKQLNEIGKQFIERYHGQAIDSASTKFNNMVRSSGNGHNIKPKKDNAVNEIRDVKSHASDNGKERAQEAKSDNKVMTKEQAQQWHKAQRGG